MHLYQSAISDRARFHGKTRADFISLEASIHDYAGVSPVNNGNSSQDLPPYTQSEGNIDHQAAVSLQELSHANQRNPEAIQVESQDLQTYDGWVEIWPIWGEQQFIPYAIGGIPFDYNLQPSSL
jgi:hypothetical protein